MQACMHVPVYTPEVDVDCGGGGKHIIAHIALQAGHCSRGARLQCVCSVCVCVRERERGLCVHIVYG